MNLWQTHQETLIAACYQTSGPIIELGTGDGSTPLLHSTFPERLIISVDTKIEWLQKFFYLASQRHFFMLVKDFTHFELPVQHAGVLFIDSAPAEQRPMCINRFASMADLIVVHDTELQTLDIVGEIALTSSSMYGSTNAMRIGPQSSASHNLSNFNEI